MKRPYTTLLLIVVLLSAVSCEKYLDLKSASNLNIADTPEALQALLDNDFKINATGLVAPEISADDYYINDNTLPSLQVDQRRMYIWEADRLFSNPGTNDWVLGYNKVFVANVVIDNVEALYEKGYNQAELNNIKGQALFIRSKAFFELAVTFALAYGSTDNNGMGIPLRLTSDISEKITRASLEETFKRITDDLQMAAGLLSQYPKHVLRASKPAAYALQARVFLYMRNYEKCREAAVASLNLQNTLLPYVEPHIPNIGAQYPFNAPSLQYKNPEIIYSSRTLQPGILGLAYSQIDSSLISLYASGDNRKKVYFNEVTSAGRTVYKFKGSYDGSTSLFDGIAVDEVYLMKAESQARLNQTSEAMQTLNALLKTRWYDPQAYTGLTAANKEEALNIILAERRKSLVMRGLRWMDIKRLNSEGRGIVLKRIINGTVYTLPPNDLRYAMAIPESIIDNSAISQNKR